MRVKHLIIDRELFPARRILQQGVDENFSIISNKGIGNLKQLNATLATNDKVKSFSKSSGIDVEYLVQLKREANSFLSKPVKLIAFPDVDISLVQALENLQIKQSKHYFEWVQQKGLLKIAQILKFDKDTLLELFCLCDLSRIWGVGPIFARLVYSVGIHSVQDFVKADPVLAYKSFMKANTKLQLTKALFIDSDIVFCNRMAKELSIVDYANL